MLSTSLFANENIASTIASNILAGELNPVLRVVCYVLSNKFRRICHLRYRVQDNLICLPSACSITCNKHCVQQILPCDFFLQHCRQQILSCVYLPQHWGQRIISYGFLLPHSTANYIGSPICDIASNSVQCVSCTFARNKYYRLSSFGNRRSTSCHFNFTPRATLKVLTCGPKFRQSCTLEPLCSVGLPSPLFRLCSCSLITDHYSRV